MDGQDRDFDRRRLVAGMMLVAATAPFAGSAGAQALGAGLTGVLGKASDNALDKLSVPGAFYADTAIRILLPGLGNAGGLLGQVMGATDKLGLTSGLTRSLNDAAGLAAKEAKPVFHKAITGLQLTDVPGIVSQNDGATQYLKRSAGTDLQIKVKPLIVSALEKVGAFRQLDQLGKRSSLISSLGLNRDKLSNSVTDQALSGIYKYIGGEEAKLRGNPLGPLGGVLKGIL